MTIASASNTSVISPAAMSVSQPYVTWLTYTGRDSIVRDTIWPIHKQICDFA